MHYSSPTEASFTCSVAGRDGVKGQRRGSALKCENERPRSSKGALMDLEIQVGDMKEGQVRHRSSEVVRSYQTVSNKKENRVCRRCKSSSRLSK